MTMIAATECRRGLDGILHGKYVFYSGGVASDETIVCIMQAWMAGEQLMSHIHPNRAEECHNAEAPKDAGYGCNCCFPDGHCMFWNAE